MFSHEDSRKLGANKLRKEKDRLQKIQRQLHEKKSFTDEESSNLALELDDINRQLR